MLAARQIALVVAQEGEHHSLCHLMGSFPMLQDNEQWLHSARTAQGFRMHYPVRVIVPEPTAGSLQGAGRSSVLQITLLVLAA